MEQTKAYFSLPVTKSNFVDNNISWEEWHKSLALWNLHYALDSPSIEDPPTSSAMHHSSAQNFTFARESPVSTFSASTFSDGSLTTMNNYMESMRPIISDQGVPGSGDLESHPVYQHVEQNSSAHAPFPHHFSPPALLSGYPVPRTLATPTQHSPGLGVEMSPDEPTDDYSNSPSSFSQHWEEMKPSPTRLAAPSSSPGSKRSSMNMSEEPTLPEAKKRASPKSRHRRSATECSEPSSRTAKLAHNIVERNYRDRLNDQITELSSYLFDFPADSKARSKPPKSLVISRAKERLMELTGHNEELVTQVAKLKQQIAVLNHIVAAGSGRQV